VAVLGDAELLCGGGTEPDHGQHLTSINVLSVRCAMAAPDICDVDKIMSIRQSIRAILAAAALLGAVGLAEAQTMAYADPGATNLRAGPGTNYASIGIVYGGTQVYVHYCEYGWCYVTVNGRNGWMAESRVAFTQGPVVVGPEPYYVPAPRYVPRYEPYFGFGLGQRYRPYYDRHRREDRRPREEGWSSEGPGFHFGDGNRRREDRRRRDDRRPREEGWSSEGPGFHSGDGDRRREDRRRRGDHGSREEGWSSEGEGQGSDWWRRRRREVH
jgi:uncharacterized protein YraI